MSKKEFEVGQRVQRYDYQTKIMSVGSILSLEKETVPASRDYFGRQNPAYDRVKAALVKWDDGTEGRVESYEIRAEDSELEHQFRTTANEIMNKINEKLALASKYLGEAEALADEHGIPFSSNISPLGQSYSPESFETKWEGIDKEMMQEVTGTYNEYSGWEHSAVC